MSLIDSLPENEVAYKRGLLFDTLRYLSDQYLEEDDTTLEEYAQDLSKVYSGGYRQLYSELYLVLWEISDGDFDKLQPLIANLTILCRYVGGSDKWMKKDPELFGHLLKLNDHINLEMQRVFEYRNNEARFEQLYENMSDLYNETKGLDNRIGKTAKKVRGIQLEMVSILAIFAAIVVAFSGGMNVIGGAISSVGDADLKNLAFIVVLCGIVLFNTLAFLLYSVIWIIHRLNHSDNTEESIFLDRFYVIGFNIVLIVLLVIIYAFL